MGLIMRNRKCYTGKVKEQPVYSTDEQCIGYIDINGTQKKLYRKTYTGTFGTLTNGAITSIQLDNQATYRLQKVTGWCEHSSGRVMLPYTYATPNISQLFLVNQVYTGIIALNYYLASGVISYNNQSYEVTIEYTKTTD